MAIIAIFEVVSKRLKRCRFQHHMCHLHQEVNKYKMGLIKAFMCRGRARIGCQQTWSMLNLKFFLDIMIIHWPLCLLPCWISRPAQSSQQNQIITSRQTPPQQQTWIIIYKSQIHTSYIRSTMWMARPTFMNTIKYLKRMHFNGGRIS